MVIHTDGKQKETDLTLVDSQEIQREDKRKFLAFAECRCTARCRLFRKTFQDVTPRKPNMICFVYTGFQ